METSQPPKLVILAGPNGAGKSTVAGSLLPPGLEFVNADEIAKTLPGYPSKHIDREAGRITLVRMGELANLRRDFAVETTLAGKTLALRITQLREVGYTCRLIFLWVPNPEFCVARVASRVRSGGHDIPEATIRRRYHAGIRNFLQVYRPRVDLWEVHQNMGMTGPSIIAEGQGDSTSGVHDRYLWNRVIGGFEHVL